VAQRRKNRLNDVLAKAIEAWKLKAAYTLSAILLCYFLIPRAPTITFDSPKVPSPAIFANAIKRVLFAQQRFLWPKEGKTG
jgi:hypothetical protein